MMRQFYIAFAAVLLVGCGSSGPKTPIVQFIGVDASGSAKEFSDDFFIYARNAIEETPLNGTVELYRFDSKVNEIYVGPPIDAHQFRSKFEGSMVSETKTRGTSLLTLMERIDQRMGSYSGKSYRILIATDCGVELMSKDELAKLKALAQKWRDNGSVSELKVEGVRPMHLDVLRENLGVLGEKLLLR